MNAVTMMQNALIAKLKTLFGKRVLIEPLAGAWNKDTHKRILKSPPAIYVSWLGNKAGKPYERTHTWALFVIAQVLNGVRPREIEAHDIIERIEFQLNNAKLKNENGQIGGPLEHRQTDNLWTDEDSSSGISVFAITFHQAMIVVGDSATGELDDFLSLFDTTKDSQTGETIMEAHIYPRNPNGMP